MDAVGMEFAYLEEEERKLSRLIQRNRMALYGDHIKNGGSYAVPLDMQESMGEAALLLAEAGIDLLAAPEEGVDDDTTD